MRRLLPLTLTLAVLAAAPATAHAAPGLELGLQDDAVLFERVYGDSQLALDRAAELGVDYIRVLVPWAKTLTPAQAKAKKKPKKVNYDLHKLDLLQTEAESLGISLEVTLTGPAPAWAAGNKKVDFWTPNPKEFATFAKTVARTFAGRIDRYSIWNEPNYNNRLEPPSQGPILYREIFLQSSKAIRAADPSAKVFIGELAPGANKANSVPALRFLRGMVCLEKRYNPPKKCKPLVADGFAMHPYNFAKRPKQAKSSNPDIVEIGSLDRLTKTLDTLAKKKLLKTRNGKKMPLYLTEFGYFTDGPLGLTEQAHADYMAEAWGIAKANPRVKQLLQYQLIDPWWDTITWRSAIMSRDAVPRLAFTRLAQLAR